MRKIVMRMVSILLLSVILLAVFLSGCQIEPQAGNDQTTQPGNDKTTQVGNDETTQVGNDETTQVGIDQTLLTQEQREEISAAHGKNYAPLSWYETDGLGAYYLGEFDGCIVYYNFRGWDPRDNGKNFGDVLPSTFSVALLPFPPGYRDQLFAYKDGEVARLPIAYLNKKWVSKEDVEQVRIAYNAFIQYMIGLGESGYLELEKQVMLKQLDFDRNVTLHGLMSDSEYEQRKAHILNLTESPDYQLFLDALKEQEE